MASGGSYHINEHGDRELKQRSGHAQPQPPAAPAKQKVNTNEDEKKGPAGRG
ncbi:hypothetical protein [Oceanisphaera sp. KMM 10153]|uniref:hypothetical protein n=1 Tax=Oceanisphaera submarina TaxID=3390193 RepID=UPI003974EE94